MSDNPASIDQTAFPFPLEAGGFRLAMGLRHITDADWLLPGPDRAKQMTERARLLGEQPDSVLACLPSAERAAGIVLSLFDPDAAGANGVAALRALGHLVQEDFCIMQRPANEDSYRLTGAVLCFPNRWRLADKLGQPMAGIHTPVPAYADKLQKPVDRFFASLKPGKIVMRHNWSLHADSILFQPASSSEDHDRAVASVTASNAGETVFMRVERQTLRRIEDAGDDTILFTIRTLIAPLAMAADTTDKRQALDDNLTTMPQDMQRYKAMAGLLDPVRSWIMAQQ